MDKKKQPPIAPGNDTDVSYKEKKLLEIKAEVKSKERLLNQISEQISGNMTDAKMQALVRKLEDEVMVRDKQIDILNDKLILLDAKMREAQTNVNAAALEQKDAQIKRLQGQLDTIRDEKFQEEETSDALRQEIAALKQEAIETQSNVTEKLRLENDLLISKVSKLESELKNIRSDYTKLSSNYESVNQFNSSLAARVTELETEIDHKSSEQMMSTQRLREFEVQDQKIESMQDDNDKLRKEIETLSQACDSLQAAKEASDLIMSQQENKIEIITKRLEDQIEKCRALEEQLSSQESELLAQLHAVIDQLEATKAELLGMKAQLSEANTATSDAKIEAAQQDRILRTEIESLQQHIRQADFDAKNQTQNQALLNERIVELEHYNERLKTVQEEETERQSKVVTQLTEELSMLKPKLERNRAAKQAAKVESHQTTIKLETLQKRFDDYQAKVKASDRRVETIENELKSAKAMIHRLRVDAHTRDKDADDRDRSLKSALGRVKSLEEQLWQKDSDLIQRDSLILTLQKTVDELRKKGQSMAARQKERQKRENEAINAKLEQQEDEIRILKEMIRGSQAEISQKNTDLARFRKRLNVGQAASPTPASRSARIPKPINGMRASQSNRELHSPKKPKAATSRALPPSLTESATLVTDAINAYTDALNDIRLYEKNMRESTEDEESLSDTVEEKLQSAKNVFASQLEKVPNYETLELPLSVLACEDAEFRARMRALGEVIQVQQLLYLTD